MKTDHYITFLLSGGILIWIIDAVFDFLFFYPSTLMDLLIQNVPPTEIYTRITLILSFWGICLTITRFNSKQNQLQEKLKQSESQLHQQTHDLEERVKELNCLFSISNIFQNPQTTIEHVFQKTVELIPPAWQYPENTCARLTIQNQIFQTHNFKQTNWKQNRKIILHDQPIGMLEVCYTNIKSNKDHNPFLEEEQRLLDAIAEQLSQLIERWNTEKALRESEKAFRNLFENNHSIMLIIDPETSDIIDANPTACRFYGYSHDELIQKKITSINMLSKEEIFQEMNRAKTQKRQYFNFRHRLTNGETRNVEVYSGPVERHGKTFLFSIVHDITTRKQTEDALWKTQERFRQIIERSPIPMVIIDQQYDVEYVNRKFTQIFGYENDDFYTTSHWWAGIYPEDDYRKQVMNSLKILITEAKTYGTEIEPQEWNLTCKNGIVRNVEVQIVPLDEESIVVMNDVTERKQAEAALLESETRYRELVDNMSSGVAVFLANEDGDDFMFVEFNRAAEHIENMKRENVWGMSLLTLFPNMRHSVAAFRQVWEGGESIRFPVVSYDEHGKILRWHENYLYKLPSGEIVCVYDDITERKLAEEALKKNEEKLRRLSGHLQEIIEQERTMIAREIHDELGQTLTALNFDLFWLNNKLNEDTHPEIHKKLNDMSKIIETTAVKTERIVTELRPQLLDNIGLSAAIEWQIEEFTSRTQIQCQTELDDIKVDKDRSITIFRIFQEALTNVARHAQATKVNVKLYRKDGMVILQVRDNGCGIKEAEIHSLKSFGLIGMQERINFWQGTFEIWGSQNEGTTVIAYIPLGEYKND